MRSSYSLTGRSPTGDRHDLSPVRDPDVLASYLADAAHSPGGHTPLLYAPGSEAAVAEVLGRHPAVLAIGAQSSLTGGATPMGEVLLSTRRLSAISIGHDTVRVQAGVTLTALDAALRDSDRYYPPVPTFAGACAGGVVSTNAAGAATFKYGTTRPWVRALTIVLPCGDVLDIERGATLAHPDGYFELALSRGVVRVPVPAYRMPPVAKLSAGYYAAPGMDLIDLFIGSEGTLGIVTEVTLRVLPERPVFCLALVTFDDPHRAVPFVQRLRRESTAGWESSDPRAVNISAIEHMDARCLTLLRDEGADRLNGVVLPADARLALLLTLELEAGTTAADVYAQLGSWDEPDRADSSLIRLCRLLEEYGVLDRVQLAAPGDAARATQLLNVREAVPSAVNKRVGLAKQQDTRIKKVAADIIVPVEHTADLLEFCGREFDQRGLDGAVWGHISDGNFHPNVIPRSFADVESGSDAVLAFGREAIRLGGAPLAEHGVGRNPIKQRLLAEIYGDGGVDEMRAVKRAIDPDGKLAPGVLFARENLVI